MATTDAVNVLRFPEAQQNPLRLEDVARALRVIQDARIFTVPGSVSLPATGKPQQLIYQGGSLYYWNGTAWKILGSGSSSYTGIDPGSALLHGGPEFFVIASETVTIWKFAHIFLDAGAVTSDKTRVRLADNGAATTSAHGYIITAATAGATAVVKLFMGATALHYQQGDTLNPLVSGTTYYLSTNGDITDTAPTANGKIVQPLGMASSPLPGAVAALAVNIEEPVLLPVASGAGDDFFDY